MMKFIFILINLHLWNFLKCLFICNNHKCITNVYLNQKTRRNCLELLPLLTTSCKYCYLKCYGPEIRKSFAVITQKKVFYVVFEQFSLFSHKFMFNHFILNVLVGKGEVIHGVQKNNVTLFFFDKSKLFLFENNRKLLKKRITFSSLHDYLRSEVLREISRCLKSPILHKINKRSVPKDYEASLELLNLRDEVVDNVMYSFTTEMIPSSFLGKKRACDNSQDVLKNSIQKIIAENGHLTLNCPDVTVEFKVEWFKNKAKLNSSFRSNMAETEKEPHLTIDSYNTLYILQATKEEEGNYTCYIDGKPFQTYCVRVVSKSKLLNEDFFRYSLYLAFVLSLTITCYCAGIGVAWHQRGYFADPLYLSLNK